jgi:hypothetical protein
MWCEVLPKALCTLAAVWLVRVDVCVTTEFFAFDYAGICHCEASESLLTDFLLCIARFWVMFRAYHDGGTFLVSTPVRFVCEQGRKLRGRSGRC